MKKILLGLFCVVGSFSVKAQQTLTITNTTGCTLDVWADAYDPSSPCPTGCTIPTTTKVIGSGAVFTVSDLMSTPGAPNWKFFVLNVRVHNPGGSDEGCYVGDAVAPFFYPLNCSFTGCGPTVNVTWGALSGGAGGSVPITIN